MEQIFNNARIVLRNEVLNGSLGIDGDAIRDVGTTSCLPQAIDLDGDFLLPGLVDIHTDNIEVHFFPRSGVIWPTALPAILTHDLQMAGAGITTVLDSLSLGDYDQEGKRGEVLARVVQAIDHANAADFLRSEHYFHFRCELCDQRFEEIVDPFRAHRRLRLLSVMDHTPGQGQWRNLEVFRENRRRRKGQVWTDEAFAEYLEQCRERQARFVPANRSLALQIARENGVPVASHDDTTEEDVDSAYNIGVRISEFPTTSEAATAAHSRGMHVVMGSPNVILKKSHSGNVSALALAERGTLSILSSDYVPTSLLQAAFDLAPFMPLPDAIATVTRVPAEAIGFDDRGEIAAGRRADLIRVRTTPEGPVVRSVWRGGRQVL